MSDTTLTLDENELKQSGLIASELLKGISGASTREELAGYSDATIGSVSKLHYIVKHSDITKVSINLNPIRPIPPYIIRLRVLPHKRLVSPLEVIVEPDGEGFLARTVDLPLYSYGESRIDAIDKLKNQIESLYDELVEDDEFSDEWLNYKRFLKEIIADEK